MHRLRTTELASAVGRTARALVALAAAAVVATAPGALPERPPAGAAPAAARACPTGSCDPGSENSFTAQTPVLLAGGGLVAIGEVRPGDVVLATDPHTGTSAPQPVLAVVVGAGTKPLVAVHVAAAAGGESAPLVVTAEHALYVVGRGWTAAHALLPGDRLAASGGPGGAVKRVDALGVRPGAAVVNLAVAGPQTFGVVTGGVAFVAQAAAPAP